MTMQTQLVTDKQDWQIGLTNYTTEGDFVAPAIQSDTPSGVDSTTTTANTIVANCTGSSVIILPFGAGSDTNTFDIRVYGWSKILKGAGNAASGATLDLWVPILLTQETVTLSTPVGLANSPINTTTPAGDTVLFPDTLAANAITGTDNIERISPANNLMAGAVAVDLFGSEKIEIRFDMTGATSGNALFRFI